MRLEPLITPRLPSVAVAAALLLAATAQAVMLHPSGQGEVLIYPYYDARAGHQTVLSVINDEHFGKAVKLHVREAENGRPVATLNLYLGEYDVWTAILFAGPDGRPALTTRDQSCTVPALKNSNVLPQLPGGSRYLPLSSASYTGTHADQGSATPQRAATGFVELIEMGALVKQSPSDGYATHVNGVPGDCPKLEAAWGDGKAGYWSRDPDTDLMPPTGHLGGSATVARITEASAFSVPATALAHFSVVAQHTAPGNALPDLSSAVTDPTRVLVESSAVIDGRIVRSLWPQDRAIDAVSAVLSQSTQRGEYSVEPALGTRTDWVITLPTRRYYTDRQLVTSATSPFTVRFSGLVNCEFASSSPFDQEARRPVGNIDFGGIIVPQPCLCASTQVWPVGGAQIFGGGLSSCSANPLPLNYPDIQLEKGYFRVRFSGNGHRSRPALGGEQYEGLPAIGFTTLRGQPAATARGAMLERGAQPVVAESGCVRSQTDCSPR